MFEVALARAQCGLSEIGPSTLGLVPACDLSVDELQVVGDGFELGGLSVRSMSRERGQKPTVNSSIAVVRMRFCWRDQLKPEYVMVSTHRLWELLGLRVFLKLRLLRIAEGIGLLQALATGVHGFAGGGVGWEIVTRVTQ